MLALGIEIIAVRWKLPGAVREALSEDARRHDPNGIANTIAITNPGASMRARLHENRRPACLIWGEKEKRFRPLAEYAQQHMPMLTTVRLDAGHGMNMEASEQFNTAVLEFLDRCLTS